MVKFSPPPTPVKPSKAKAMVSSHLKKLGSRKKSTSSEQVRGTTLLQIMDHERWDRHRVTLERDHLRAENERLKMDLVEAKAHRDKLQDAYESVYQTTSREHREWLNLLHTFRSEISGLRMDLCYQSGESPKVPPPLKGAPRRKDGRPQLNWANMHTPKAPSYTSNASDSPTLPRHGDLLVHCGL